MGMVLRWMGRVWRSGSGGKVVCGMGVCGHEHFLRLYDMNLYDVTGRKGLGWDRKRKVAKDLGWGIYWLMVLGSIWVFIFAGLLYVTAR